MKHKQKISIIVFIIGLVALITGVLFLIVNLFKESAKETGEYLVETGRFELVDEPGVIWHFTEIGKGTLTTNNHINDYEFIWAIEGDILKIETNWLYTLNDEYKYRIEEGNLILTRDDSAEIKFVPASSVDAEVTENNELVVGD